MAGAPSFRQASGARIAPSRQRDASMRARGATATDLRPSPAPAGLPARHHTERPAPGARTIPTVPPRFFVGLGWGLALAAPFWLALAALVVLL